MVYILTTTEYFTNPRGELHSMRDIYGVYSTKESAQKKMRELRAGYMKKDGFKDISDEPDRYAGLWRYDTPFVDICIIEKELN